MAKETGKLSAVLCCTVLALFFGGRCLADDPTGAGAGLPIGSIETAGTVTVTRAQILSAVRLRVGAVFDESAVAEDAERLAGIEGVQRAWYNAEVIDGKVKLTFVVVEKGLIRQVACKGNKKVSRGKISQEIDLKVGNYLDVIEVRGAVNKIKELYLKRGYCFVEVSLDEQGLPSGRVIFNINEGPKCAVKKVSFTGNERLSDKELFKITKTSTRTFFLWSSKFQQKTVDEDVQRLLGAYQKKGYLDCRAEARTSFSEDRKHAQVEFIVSEGLLYRVEQLLVSGNQYFSSEQLREGLRLKVGRFYSEQEGDLDAKKIQSRYLAQGFVDAKVENRRRFLDGGKVIVEFAVTEGQRFRIGRIIVTGNELVQEKVVRRVMDEEGFKPGGWYNADTARGDGTGRLEQYIKQSIMAESVNVQAVGTAPDSRDAQVGLLEGQTGSIMLGAGVASDTGVIGNITLDQRNFDITDIPESWRDLILGKAFRGAGQRFRMSLNPGTVQSTFSVSFTEPYLYDMPVGLNVGASGFERWREAYNEQRLKGSFGFYKRYEDDWRRGVSFRAENVKVKDIEQDAPQEVRDVAGDNNLFGVKFYMERDTTNSIYTPTGGQIFEMDYEQVTGDYTFGVISATQRWYTTVYEDLAERKTILETKIYGASILGDAPLFEKFYAGGIGSIRGFEYRGVSPRGVSTLDPTEKKDPIGSDWIVTGSAELQVPFASDVFSLLLFTDTGMVETGGVRASVGVGIQILLKQWFGPVPMRFELAAPLMKDDEDDTQMFSFSVGALF